MSKARYRVRNKNAISRGFKSLSAHANGTADVVIRNMGRAGLANLLYAHELSEYLSEHPIHPKSSDDMLAYAVARDGSILESGRHRSDNPEFHGSAEEWARNQAASEKGRIAVVLSDMRGPFDDHEIDMLLMAEEYIAEDWGDGVSSKFLSPGSVNKPD